MKSFSFNLIPQKPKELVQKEEERDTSSVYLAGLPLIAVIIWLGSTIVNALFVLPVKNNWEKAINDQQTRINTEFKPVLLQHGELVVKTSSLSNLITKDVRPESLFKLVESLFPTEESNFQITGYARNTEGYFSVTMAADSYSTLAEIARRFNNYSGINDVTISGAFINPDIKILQGTISFYIIYQPQTNSNGG